MSHQMPLQGGSMTQNYFATGNLSKMNPANQQLMNQNKSSLDFLFEDNFEDERRLNTSLQSRIGMDLSQDESSESNQQLCAAFGNLIQQTLEQSLDEYADQLFPSAEDNLCEALAEVYQSDKYKGYCENLHLSFNQVH